MDARARWQARYDDALTAGRVRDADFTTLSGEEVDPVYGPADGAEVEERIGWPGEHPFTRGLYPTGYRGRAWTIRQFAGFGNASVERLFKWVTFLLYGVYALFLVLALLRFGDAIPAGFARSGSSDGWALGGLTYASYNVVGAVLWVGLFVLGGYFFGNIPVVRENFTLVILAIVALSVLPIAIEAIKARRSRPA